MYDQLVQIISQVYDQSQTKGLFLTTMNGNAVIQSVGVVATDRPWVEVLPKFYKTATQSPTPITKMICDIVIDAQEITNVELLKDMSHDEYGLAIMAQDGSVIGTLLPQTVGVQNLNQGLMIMKQKYGFQGIVFVVAIKTDRKVVVSQ